MALVPSRLKNSRFRLAILLDATTISGSAKVVIQNVLALPSNIEAVVFLINRKGAQVSELETEFDRLGIEFRFMEESFLFDPRPLFTILKLLSHKKIQVLESNHYKTHFIALIASRFLNIPWVAVSHGWTAEGVRMKFYNTLDRLTLPFSTACIAMGPSIATQLKRFLPRTMRVRCWETAFDPAQLADSSFGYDIRASLSIDESEFVFGAVGRFSYEKGFDLLIEAARELNESAIPFRILIVGEGPAHQGLTNSVNKYGLGNKIFFLGRKSSADMGEFYKTINCLVISSRSEGLPNVLLEAAWFKRPVVSSEVGGIPKFMNSHLTDWLVSKNSSSALAGAMKKMINLTLERRENLGTLFNSRLKESFMATKRTKRVAGLYSALFRQHSKQSKILPKI